MYSHLAKSRRFIIVLGLMTGLVAFAINISLPAIPDLVADLGTRMATGQQVVGLFMAGMAAGQLPFGLVSDRVGRMPVLYAGIGLFTLAGIVTWLAGSIEVMLVARFVQGFGSAAGLVLARAIVRDISSGTQAAKLMSVMVMVFTLAPMLAPLVGSFLVSTLGWRSAFAATTVAGIFVLYGINTSLTETYSPGPRQHILRQLFDSARAFFSHRQCVYGLLIIMTAIGGIMTLVSGSAALIIEIYGYPVDLFGWLFAMTGLSVLIGSIVNRWLLERLDALQMIGTGTTLMGITGVQLLVMAWLGAAPFWWLWGNACLFMFATALVLPNSTALALDPVPEIAGTAASIIGTLQNLVGAGAAIVYSAIYDGTILNMVVFIGVSGSAALLLLLLAPLFLERRRLTAD